MKGFFVFIAAIVAMSTAHPYKDSDLDKKRAELLQSRSSGLIEPLLLKKGVQNRIYNGELAPDHMFPYMAAIRLGGGSFCGGSILSERWILTAGHCVSDHDSWIVVVGSNTWQNGADRVSMTSTEGHLHPGFSGRPGQGIDIGVIKLPSDLTFSNHIQKIKLQTSEEADEDLDGKSTRISGWGYISGSGSGHTVQNKLRYEDLEVISNEECAKTIRHVHSYVMCTSGKGESGNKGTCSGDSGSPLVLLEGKEKGVQVGLVSFSSGGCESDHPSVYTRTAKFLGWIRNTTGLNLP